MDESNVSMADGTYTSEQWTTAADAAAYVYRSIADRADYGIRDETAALAHAVEQAIAKPFEERYDTMDDLDDARFAASKACHENGTTIIVFATRGG